ncbi:hypothetical protein EBU71_09480 [bacterium]|nr:hypothetical protein [Candidatus Elulimicrobium humile]
MTKVTSHLQIKQEELLQEFYDLARHPLYTSYEVSMILHQKYDCISREKIEEESRKYRRERYTNLEIRVNELIQYARKQAYASTYNEFDYQKR